jgi:phage repressor protein C with HTH and peptisase S24 domain
MLDMDFDAQRRREALHAFMQRTGLKKTPWETASDLGEGTLRKFLESTADDRSLTDRTYSMLAEGASKLLERRVSIAELQGGDRIVNDSARLSTEPHATLDGRQKLLFPPPMPQNEPGQYILVMGTSLAGGEGDFQMNNGDPLDKIPTPKHLANRRGLLGVLVEGESMRPWKRPGQIILLETLRRARPGDHCVVEMRATPPDEDRPAFLKLLVKQTPTKLVLAQYRPAREFEVDLKRVHKIYRVMDDDEVHGWHSGR